MGGKPFKSSKDIHEPNVFRQYSRSGTKTNTSLMGLEPLSSFMENKELVVTSDPHKIISMKLMYEKV